MLHIVFTTHSQENVKKSKKDEIQNSLSVDVFVFAYLNDIYIISDAADVRSCFDIVKLALKRLCNIDINFHDSENLGILASANTPFGGKLFGLCRS